MNVYHPKKQKINRILGPNILPAIIIWLLLVGDGRNIIRYPLGYTHLVILKIWNAISFPLFLALTSFVVGLIGFTVGGGFGTILAPILMIYGFNPKSAIVMVLISQFAGEIAAVFLHHRFRNADFGFNSREIRHGIILGVCGLSGILGAFIAIAVDNRILILYNVVILITLGSLVTFIRMPNSERNISLRKASIIGAIASLNKGLTGGNYGPTILAGSIAMGANIKKTVATISLAEAIACSFAIIGYVYGGIKIDLLSILVITIGTIFSVFPSVYMVKKLSTGSLKKFIGITMISLGILLFFKSMCI